MKMDEAKPFLKHRESDTHRNSNLTHINAGNHLPQMVSVVEKRLTARTATAQTLVRLPESVKNLLRESGGTTKKGSVFATAILAGTMAVKNTGQLIPLCHTLPVEACSFEIDFNEDGLVEIKCTVSVTSKTGVEMEALVGASLAALTIYDMCKALSHEISIESTVLLRKSGGKSDYVKS
jgi:cyclic pyranopterin monophosphate synthase